MRRWDESLELILIEKYPNTDAEKLSILLNKTVSAIHHKASRLGIGKSAEYNYKIRSERRCERSGTWKGGRQVRKKHVLIKKHDYPGADKNGYILEHRYIMQEHLGRLLKEDEIIHHKNENPLDNRIENLQIMTNAEHTRHHSTGRKQSKETRIKQSLSAKKRFSNKQNHPFYKHVDMNAINNLINNGMTIKQACKEYGICRKTYYNKLEELKNEY